MAIDHLNLKMTPGFVDDMLEALDQAYGGKPLVVLEALVLSGSPKGSWRLLRDPPGCLGLVLDPVWEAVGHKLELKETALRKSQECIRKYSNEILIHLAHTLTQSPYLGGLCTEGTIQAVRIQGPLHWYFDKKGDTVTLGAWVLAQHTKRKRGQKE